MAALTWKRDGPGRQVSTDGRYAVESDGYSPGQHIGADAQWTAGRGRLGGYEGFIGGEWAAIDLTTGTRQGENLDWFSTMREAKAECERHAARAAR